MKTNAVRLLETLGIAHRLVEYRPDPDNLSAENVAARIGMPPEQVFKTLVVRGDRNGVCLAVIPGNAGLDLKALARLTGDRRVELVPLKDVRPLTGYLRGGVTALGARRGYPVFLDESAGLFDEIAVSVGARGLQVVLSPAGYIAAVKPVIGAISRDKGC